MRKFMSVITVMVLWFIFVAYLTACAPGVKTSVEDVIAADRLCRDMISYAKAEDAKKRASCLKINVLSWEKYLYTRSRVDKKYWDGLIRPLPNDYVCPATEYTQQDHDHCVRNMLAN